MNRWLTSLVVAALCLWVGTELPLVAQTEPPPQPPKHSESSKPAIAAAAVTPDGTGFVFGSQAGVLVRAWNGGPDQSIATELDHVHHLAFAPDGSTLAVAGGSPAEFGDVELWSWPTRTLVRRLEGHADLVYAAAWLPDGNTLVTASADRSVRVWDAAAGKQLASLAGHSGPVLCLVVSPDGSLVCSGSADQTIRVWDTRSWQLVRTMTNHLGAVHDLAFRPSAEKTAEPQPVLASAAADATVRIWQPAIGRMVRIIRHPAPVFALAWLPDGQRLLSGSKDGVLRVLDPDGGAAVKQFDPAEGWTISLAVDRHGDRVVIGDSQGRIGVLRVEH